jgi:hypothetical protein
MHRAQGYLVGVAQLFGWQVTLLGWLAGRYIRAAVWLCLHSTDWSVRLKQLFGCNVPPLDCLVDADKAS